MSRNSISTSEILREDSDSGAYIETDEVADGVNIMKRIISEKREKMEDIATALGDLHTKVLRWRGKESQHLR
jgi:dsDNA-specific endonuclease/ATPase MutS2